jgi:alpha-1,3-rhamnosyl/mannosyltransferase
MTRIGIDGRYIQDHFPGIGRYTYHLIEALAPLCPEQAFVLLHNPSLPNTRYRLGALARYPNLELCRVDVPTFSLAEQLALPLTARRLSLDLLHSPYYIKPYWQPCPSVVTIYDLIPALYPQHLPSARARLVYRATTRLALATAQQVITLSEASRRDLVERYGVPAAKVHVTHLAADARFRPQPAEDVAALRQKYGLPEGYVLYLGINKPHKNLVRLIEAWAIVSGQPSAAGCQLVIAGYWDPRYPQARERAAQLGLRDRVRFLGPVAEEDLPALYSGCELFVFPSLYEGFGLPVLEAMACGAPVVCSNTSSLPEVAGDAALYFDPTDVEQMANTLVRALANRKLRQEMRARVLEQAACFSWEEAAKRTLEVYRLELLP